MHLTDSAPYLPLQAQPLPQSWALSHNPVASHLLQSSPPHQLEQHQQQKPQLSLIPDILAWSCDLTQDFCSYTQLLTPSPKLIYRKSSVELLPMFSFLCIQSTLSSHFFLFPR